MEKILIVSQGEKSINTLTELLKSDGYNNISTATSVAEARRMMIGFSYEMVIINMPLPDATGRELAFQTAQTDTAVLVIVSAGNENIFGRFGLESGIFVLTKPLNKQRYKNAVRYINSAQNRIVILREKNAKLLKTIEEMNVINKAKCWLIAQKQLSEGEAHHFIEKEAMNLQLSKYQVAERLLKTY